MSHTDRLRTQVPADLPDWMDGPTIRRVMAARDISYAAAKKSLMPWRLWRRERSGRDRRTEAERP